MVTRFNSTSRTVEQVRDLKTNDLTVQLGDVPASVVSLRIDDGPKRVAVVLDDSGRISAEEWKRETELAASFVGHARPQDTVALLLVGSHSAVSPLVSPAEVVEQLRQVSFTRPPAPDAGGRTLDTLLAAVNLLSPPRFGDAIFLFGRSDDTGSAANLEPVQEQMLRNGLRFYGLSLVDPTEKLPPGTDRNKPLPAAFNPGRLAEPSSMTGCAFEFTSLKVLAMPAQFVRFREELVPRYFPSQLELRKNHLADLYAGIAAPYRVALPASSIQNPTELRIAVADADERNINKRDIHFPRRVYPCPAPAPTAP